MAQVQLDVQVPEELLRLIDSSNLSVLDRSSQVRAALALHLFITSQISLGKAAELAGQERAAFERLLQDLDLPLVSYEREEHEHDRTTIRLLHGRLPGA